MTEYGELARAIYSAARTEKWSQETIMEMFKDPKKFAKYE